jgi:hypothetical protein
MNIVDTTSDPVIAAVSKSKMVGIASSDSIQNVSFTVIVLVS